jgi:outer membrane protein TolC
LLTETSITINKLIYLNKRIALQKNRKDNAKKLLKFFSKKLKKGETNQLAVNKAKLHLLKYETLLEELLAKKKTTLKELVRLNGGKKIDFDVNNYKTISGFPEFSKYINGYFEHHPEAKLANINLNLANKRLKVAKHQWLPDFKVGVHTEQDRNLKMHFGISIPLWQQFNHVKKAQADYNKQVYKRDDKITAINTKLKQLYQNYKTSKDNYNQYLRILDQDNTRQLLRKSLKEGEISAINYYQEIAKLYQFQDKLQNLRFNMLQSVVRLRNYELLQLK